MFSKQPKTGVYRGVLILNEVQNIQLPFNFELLFENKKPVIVIRNAEEKIRVDEIEIKEDSIVFRMPFFNSEFRCRFGKEHWEGVWINHYRKDKNIIPFKAIYKDSRRFESQPEAFAPLLEGKWEVTFTSDQGEVSHAIGMFHHIEQSNFISGTFLTETGDYRYLEGVFYRNQLHLSCFDGTHAFLFLAKLDSNQQLIGKFYSGIHWQENWTGRKNENAVLRNPETITTVKNAQSPVEFDYPDTDGKKVNIKDKLFDNKVMIVQIMGSWCPNCMDESKYLSSLYNRYNQQGLEIVALAFEKTTDFESARSHVLRMKQRIGVPYPVLITQKSGKEMASESLPFLNGITAFPTTLILDRKHRIVKIHTGFSGPATGKEFEKFSAETESLVLDLLKQ